MPNIESLRDACERMLIDEYDICEYSEELLWSRCQPLTSPLLRNIQLQSFSSDYRFNRHFQKHSL